MSISVAVDETLVEQAKRVTGLPGASEAVEKVLKEVFAAGSQHRSMFELVGRVKLRDDYDYKAMREGNGDPD